MISGRASSRPGRARGPSRRARPSRRPHGLLRDVREHRVRAAEGDHRGAGEEHALVDDLLDRPSQRAQDHRGEPDDQADHEDASGSGGAGGSVCRASSRITGPVASSARGSRRDRPVMASAQRPSQRRGQDHHDRERDAEHAQRQKGRRWPGRRVRGGRAPAATDPDDRLGDDRQDGRGEPAEDSAVTMRCRRTRRRWRRVRASRRRLAARRGRRRRCPPRDRSAASRCRPRAAGPQGRAGACSSSGVQEALLADPPLSRRPASAA